MMRERILRIVILLGALALTIWILERMWAFSQTLSSVVSTLAGAWFLAFAARPFIEVLHRTVFPVSLLRWVNRRYGPHWEHIMARWRLPYGVAVALVYIAMVVVVVG